jgi:hypothetical protein
MVITQTDKDLYRELCKGRQDIPLFMQSWWMDAVCNSEKKHWNVLLVKVNGTIVGAMPYHELTKFGLKFIIQPQLTQYSGLWIDYPNNQTARQKIFFERMVISNIILQIKSNNFSFFQQTFHFSFTNWQPFYWNNFKQTTNYTYIIKDISNPQNVFNNFHKFKQKHIKKAQRDLSVDFNLTPFEFYDFQKETLKIKGDKITYSKELFINIYIKAFERKQGKIIAIKDKENNINSAAFIVWDKYSAYYLISAIHPNFSSSGASSLMVWEAIKYVNDKTIFFDFEGSMIERVARSFEEFGAEQIPYFKIFKTNNLLNKLVNLRNRF